MNSRSHPRASHHGFTQHVAEINGVIIRLPPFRGVNFRFSSISDRSIPVTGSTFGRGSSSEGKWFNGKLPLISRQMLRGLIAAQEPAGRGFPPRCRMKNHGLRILLKDVPDPLGTTVELVYCGCLPSLAYGCSFIHGCSFSDKPSF